MRQVICKMSLLSFYLVELMQICFGSCVYMFRSRDSGGFLLPRLCLLLLILGQVGGCTSLTTAQRWDQLVQRGEVDGFKAEVFSTQPFILNGLIKQSSEGSSELVVYLEGDGRGIINGRVSHDPTPYNITGYELARVDPAPSILYLARVGQFQPLYTGSKYKKYWSNKRLAKKSVQSAGQALDQAKALTKATHLHLVGYSGGGGLALLLAEQRADVLSVTTVAGLLDIRWWVEEKNYKVLRGSLNPADQVDAIVDLAQVHFFGIDDVIIPTGMSAHFQRLAPFTNFRRVEVDTNHWDNWPKLWPGLLNKYIVELRVESFRTEDTGK